MDFFGSIFSQGTTVGSFFLCIGLAFIVGVIFSTMCYFKTRSSKSFFITTAMMPATVAMVIMLVNGNIGVGVAVAGAFSLVRFRSAPGTAKEISIIFVAMATGLAFGIGYVAYASIFAILCGGLLMLASHFKAWEPRISDKDRILKVTIPENLDYQEVFNDLFNEYTVEVEMLRVKTINMGSMFRLTYRIKFKDANREKEFIDQIRCRNGNLEVALEREEYTAQEL